MFISTSTVMSSASATHKQQVWRILKKMEVVKLKFPQTYKSHFRPPAMSELLFDVTLSLSQRWLETSLQKLENDYPRLVNSRMPQWNEFIISWWFKAGNPTFRHCMTSHTSLICPLRIQPKKERPWVAGAFLILTRPIQRSHHLLLES